MTRYDRLNLGLPLCSTLGCPYAPGPGRNGRPRRHCRRCAATSTDKAGHPKRLGPSEAFLVLWPVALLGEARMRAQQERLSAAEWIRRVVAKALEASCNNSPST